MEDVAEGRRDSRGFKYLSSLAHGEDDPLGSSNENLLLTPVSYAASSPVKAVTNQTGPGLSATRYLSIACPTMPLQSHLHVWRFRTLAEPCHPVCKGHVLALEAGTRKDVSKAQRGLHQIVSPAATSGSIIVDDVLQGFRRFARLARLASKVTRVTERNPSCQTADHASFHFVFQNLAWKIFASSNTLPAVAKPTRI